MYINSVWSHWFEEEEEEILVGVSPGHKHLQFSEFVVLVHLKKIITLTKKLRAFILVLLLAI